MAEENRNITENGLNETASDPRRNLAEEERLWTQAAMVYAGPQQMSSGGGGMNSVFFTQTAAVYAGPMQMNNGMDNLAAIGMLSMQQQMEEAAKKNGSMPEGSKHEGVYGFCPECGKEVRKEKFCPECGTPLKDITKYIDCPSCGARSGAENKFCRECGAKLYPEEA